MEGTDDGKWCHVPSKPDHKHAGRSVKMGGDFSNREKSPVTVNSMYVIVFLCVCVCVCIYIYMREPAIERF